MRRMPGRKSNEKDRVIGEIEMIADYFAPLAANTPGSFGLRDDAACLSPSPNRDLVITCDALVAGVHFFPDDRPEDIAWKALAVNVSDLAAKGARPLVYLLSIAVSEPPQRGWLAAFVQGLAEAQSSFGIGLAGGDTTSTSGPLTLCITALGETSRRAMPRRDGGRPGHVVYVSGSIGDAALGLKLRRGDASPADWRLDAAQAEGLINRYLRPQPRLALAPILAAHAAATLDISDGLILDLSRLCQASGVGAKIEADAVPLSEAGRISLKHRPELLETILTGGDDYEILAAIAPEREDLFTAAAAEVGVAVMRIGVLMEDPAIEAMGLDGLPLRFPIKGYEHFSKAILPSSPSPGR